MNTAIAITAIIAAVAVINSAIIAARDTAKAKHQTAAHCKTCTCDKNKEQA
ncbi:hypothetical protein [Streptomyces sp. NPDC001530]|uniref:hypothetical protein n=1 Tax=Streptomyces sp. NPDC001530 TaxID=3364582 RepID=UPI0036CF241F